MNDVLRPLPHDLRRRRVIAAIGVSLMVLAGVIITVAVATGDDTKHVQSAPDTAAPTSVAPSTTGAAPDTAAPDTTAAPVETLPDDSLDTVLHPTVTPPPTPPPTPVSVITTSSPTTVKPTSSTTPTASTTKAGSGGTGSTGSTGNCTDVGSISIPATGVSQRILAEATAFKDGLLCGNHKADHIGEGVDILPGFASFTDSVNGGASLIGRVPAIIFGHRNSHNRPFHDINRLKAGDAVIIQENDGSTINLVVVSVQLVQVKTATTMLLSPSTDGAPQVRLVACSHRDGTPGGVDYRWIATLARA